MWAHIALLYEELPPITIALLVAWLITMISLPVVEWLGGDRARTIGIAAGVVLQAATVLTSMVAAWGQRTTLGLAATIILSGWLVEFVGSHTGFPFGRYGYTDRLQPQIGRVPVVIPLAWLMMMPPAWAIGSSITARVGVASWATEPIFITASALAFTAWDLFLDPQMVRWRLWIWEPSRRRRASYFGIPWSNYLGWFLVSAIITWLASPGDLAWDLAQPVLLAIYGLTWALETVGQLIFWRLPGPAVAGAAGMGLCLLGALL